MGPLAVILLTLALAASGQDASTLAPNATLEDWDYDSTQETPLGFAADGGNVLRIPWGPRNEQSQPQQSPPQRKGLEELLDLYSPSRLARTWNSTRLNSTCASHIQLFLTAVSERSLWALQMVDASGRYGGSFLWGNPYWLGSATLCKNINPQPPFPLGFFVVKANIEINSVITPHTKTQLLGVCLPSSCSGKEVEDLVTTSVGGAGLDKERSVELSVIKTPHNAYVFTDDPVFWTLTVVTLVVFALVSLGTLLDLYQEWAMDKGKPSNFVYDNYTDEISKQHHQSVIAGSVKVQISSNNNENSDGGTPESSERNSVTSEDTEQKYSVWSEVMLAFSARKNMLTICDRSVGVDTIPTIHGLRSISMAWVILGHTCIVAFKYSDNMSYRALVEKELIFQTINNGAYSVDTFFFISGLLFSFLYFRTTAKNDINKITKTTGLKSHFLEFLGIILYRFCRLTAPYFFVLGVVQVTMKWFHYNSVFEPPATDYINCPKYWWRNLLYINTLFPVKDMCMLWSWYLADDTQFYVLGAVLLIIAAKRFWAAFTLMIVFLISSLTTTAFIAYNNQHIPNNDDPLALFDKIYDKPWTRLGPYLIGMCVGWILFKTDCKIKMRKVTVFIGWVLSISLLLALVYGLFGSKLSRVSGAAFSSLSHTAWTLALAWIVIACSTGYGGYVESILSSSILYPFSRVTYCAYLVHPIVIRFTAMRMDSPVHLGPEMVTVMFIGELVLSYLIAFVVSLMFEAPIVSLLRIVSPTKRKIK